MSQGIGQQNQGLHSVGSKRVANLPRMWFICITDENFNTHRTSKDSHNPEAKGSGGFNTFKDYTRRELWANHHKQKQSASLGLELRTSTSGRRITSQSARVEIVEVMKGNYETSRRPQPKLEPPTCPALVCWECMGHRIGRQANTRVVGAYRHLRFGEGTGLLYGESRALGK